MRRLFVFASMMLVVVCTQAQLTVASTGDGQMAASKRMVLTE